MRMNKRITFVNKTNSYYDPIEGGFVDGEIIETTKPCNLSTMKIERTKELFGEIDKVVLVARLQHPYIEKVDYTLIDGVRYNVIRQSNHRKGVFYLEQSNET